MSGSRVTFLGVPGARFAVARDGKRVGTIDASGDRLVLSAQLDGRHTYVLTPLG